MSQRFNEVRCILRRNTTKKHTQRKILKKNETASTKKYAVFTNHKPVKD